MNLKLLLCFSFALAGHLFSDSLRLASPFGEHMVIQREQTVPVWGWTKPGTTVTVSFNGNKSQAQAGPDGRWKCELPAMKATGPSAFKVSDGKEMITFKDVLVGEVWICCGQSNMEMKWGGMKDIRNMIKERQASKAPVRTLEVKQMISFEEEELCSGATWKQEPPSSAVAATFAYQLQKALNVPVGIVLTCWGSSSIEGWMPKDMSDVLPHFKKELENKLGGKYLKLTQDIVKNAKATGELQYSKTPEIVELLKGEHRYTQNANIFSRTRPNLLYNAMLHPLIPMACRGMVYYQGEANSKGFEPMVQYGKTQPLWLKRLRKAWGRDDFYFLNCMLPKYGKIYKHVPESNKLEYPDNHSWAIIRESQTKVLQLPNSDIVNTIDLGLAHNIHPKDKKPIGDRLALLARRNVYGEHELLARGPSFSKVKANDQEVSITLNDSDGLKTSDGGAPKGFWTSSDGRTWTPAKAKIQAEKVIILLNGEAPKFIRYAYAAAPEVNLINGAELPAYPFNISLP